MTDFVSTRCIRCGTPSQGTGQFCATCAEQKRTEEAERAERVAKAIADALVAARPDRYTANPLKKTREGKIFVDYLRNQRGGSAIVNYSTRAKKGAPVACPLRWDELKGLKVAAPYTARTLPARLKALKREGKF